jgi:hypothetical protein
MFFQRRVHICGSAWFTIFYVKNTKIPFLSLLNREQTLNTVKQATDNSILYIGYHRPACMGNWKHPSLPPVFCILLLAGPKIIKVDIDEQAKGKTKDLRQICTQNSDVRLYCAL